MSSDEVIARANLDDYLVIPLEKTVVKDAQVYFTNQLAFGPKGNELVFVETPALETE
jgi:hypothetical protein